MFDPSDKVRVQEATDLVRLVAESIALKKKGKDYVGLCPFHNDRTPSMGVSPTKQIYKCWSCGAGGDCFSWMMNFHGMTFPEAIQALAEKNGLQLSPRKPASRGGTSTDDRGDVESIDPGVSKEDLARANAFACEFFKVILRSPEHGAAARAVLQKRGVSKEIVERFGLGAAPDKWDGLLQTVEKKGLDVRPFIAAGLFKRRESGGGLYDGFRNRVMFPIHGPLGQVLAFGARRINDQDNPKYLNSAESVLFNKSATLYALPQAVKPPEGLRGLRDEKCAVVVEGYMDAIACHQAGVCNVVATLGTALNSQGARVLSRQCEKVVLLFDGDDAGQRAADRAVEVLFDSTLEVRIATMTRAREFGGGDAKDPDELVKQPGGADVLRKVIAAGNEALDHRAMRLGERVQGQGVQGRARLIEEEVQRLAELGLARLNPLRKQMMVKRIAQLAGVPESVIRDALAKARPGRRDDAREDGEGVVARIKPEGPRETALACLLTDPAAWEGLSQVQRGLLASSNFERDTPGRLAGFVAEMANAGQTFTIARLRGIVDDESVVQCAIDFTSEVERQIGDDDSGQGARRMLLGCVARIEGETARQGRLSRLRTALGGAGPQGVE